MYKNRKVPAVGLLVSLGVVILGNGFGASLELIGLAGLGMIVFGIWSSVILLKK